MITAHIRYFPIQLMIYYYIRVDLKISHREGCFRHLNNYSTGVVKENYLMFSLHTRLRRPIPEHPPQDIQPELSAVPSLNFLTR